MAEQVAKAKKKQWYSIVAPKQFENVVLGETLVTEPGLMMGKTLSHSLMNLTNDMKKQNINIHFKVTEIEGDKGKTSIIGYQIVPSSVKRLVRRNSEKMDLSFIAETSDNIILRVKPLVVTRGLVKGSVGAKMRNYVVQYLIKTIKKLTFDEFMNELITHKMQSTMRAALNKVYPLKVCEIRYAGIDIGDKPKNVPEAVEPAEVAESDEEIESPAKVEN